MCVGGHPRACTSSGCNRRAVVDPKGIMTIYIALARSLMEYASEVWHTGLQTVHQREPLEQVQQDALRVAYPDQSYSVALLITGLDTRRDRHENLCRSFFVNIRNPSYNLFYLVSTPRGGRFDLRNPTEFSRTGHNKRFCYSLIPYSGTNGQ